MEKLSDLALKALAGDEEAQAEATRMNVALPCPMCYGAIEVDKIESSPSEIAVTFRCKECGLEVTKTQRFSIWEDKKRFPDDPTPLAQWNSRPKLEGK